MSSVYYSYICGHAYAAKISGAELTGLAIIDLPGIKKSVGPVPAGGIHLSRSVVEKQHNNAAEYVKTLLENFEKKCTDAGVAFNSVELQGRPSEELLKLSIFHDLSVVGMRTFITSPTIETEEDMYHVL